MAVECGVFDYYVSRVWYKGVLVGEHQPVRRACTAVGSEMSKMEWGGKLQSDILSYLNCE